MINPFVIRKARPEDAEAIAVIEKQVFSCPWSVKSVADEIENPITEFIVCERNGSVTGYISMQCICGECYIGNLAVAPEYQRQKAASNLLASLIAIAKEKQAEFVTLEVRASNMPARALYEKYGFLRAGERKNYYTGPVENAVIYTLFLNKGEPDESVGN